MFGFVRGFNRGHANSERSASGDCLRVGARRARRRLSSLRSAKLGAQINGSSFQHDNFGQAADLVARRAPIQVSRKLQIESHGKQAVAALVTVKVATTTTTQRQQQANGIATIERAAANLKSPLERQALAFALALRYATLSLLYWRQRSVQQTATTTTTTTTSNSTSTGTNGGGASYLSSPFQVGHLLRLTNLTICQWTPALALALLFILCVNNLTNSVLASQQQQQQQQARAAPPPRSSAVKSATGSPYQAYQQRFRSPASRLRATSPRASTLPIRRIGHLWSSAASAPLRDNEDQAQGDLISESSDIVARVANNDSTWPSSAIGDGINEQKLNSDAQMFESERTSKRRQHNPSSPVAQTESRELSFRQATSATPAEAAASPPPESHWIPIVSLSSTTNHRLPIAGHLQNGHGQAASALLDYPPPPPPPPPHLSSAVAPRVAVASAAQQQHSASGQRSPALSPDQQLKQENGRSQARHSQAPIERQHVARAQASSVAKVDARPRPASEVLHSTASHHNEFHANSFNHHQQPYQNNHHHHHYHHHQMPPATATNVHWHQPATVLNYGGGHRRPRFNTQPQYSIAAPAIIENEIAPPSAISSKMYTRVLLCDKTLVSLDYVRNLESEPRPFGQTHAANVYKLTGPSTTSLAPPSSSSENILDEVLNDIGDNLIDLDAHYSSLSGSLATSIAGTSGNSSVGRLAGDHSPSGVSVRRRSRRAHRTNPMHSDDAAAAELQAGGASLMPTLPSGGAGEAVTANQTAANVTATMQPPLSERLLASASGAAADVAGGTLAALEQARRSSSYALLNDEDPLVRCDMWDLEKGLKSRKPPEHLLRVAIKADFDTVRDAINRCRQLSEKTLPPEDEYRDGLEIMSTEDLVSLFSMKRGLIPGTKWCGLGDQANSYNDLGPKHRIDICCRAHDHCPIRSKPFRNDYGVLNIGLYTKSHCDCDADFYRCLREARSRTADMLGNLYFNVMKLQCMREERLKVCREMKPIALGFERCVRYEESPVKTVFKFTTPPVAY